MSPLRTIRPGTVSSVEDKIPPLLKPVVEGLSKLKKSFVDSSPKEKEFKKKIFSTGKPSPKTVETPLPTKIPAVEGASSPPFLVPLPETPVEDRKPKESLHRPHEEQAPILSEEELLKPDFLPGNQPKDPKISAHQPLSEKGGGQPEETPPPPPKIRGEEQPILTEGPILGEIPPTCMGGPATPLTIQFHNSGTAVRTYKDEDGFTVTEFKQPNDPEEPWLATIEVKTKIIDGVERKAFGQISFDPSK